MAAATQICKQKREKKSVTHNIKIHWKNYVKNVIKKIQEEKN